MIARALLASLALTASASATITSLDLNNYQLTATIALPAAAAEASAITFNWDTGTLFVLGDEGDALVEISRTGTVLGTMALTGFADTEGLTYTGNGVFVIGEERLQDVYQLTYTNGGTRDRSALTTASIGPTVGNIGIEGFSFDPRNNRFVLVKEKSPQGIYDTAITFGPQPAAGNINPANLFDPTLLGVLDLSDVQVLSTVNSLLGTADEDNLLIYSQESARLLEVTRTGVILSSFDFRSIATDAEGVTIDDQGVIYIAGEAPAVYVLTPIPTPGASSVLVLAGLAATRRRRA